MRNSIVSLLLGLLAIFLVISVSSCGLSIGESPAPQPPETDISGLITSESSEERSIAEVIVIIEDASEEITEFLHPGDIYRVTRGPNIVAEISVTSREVRVQTEESEYHLSFSTGDDSWERIIKGTKITIHLYETSLEEVDLTGYEPSLAIVYHGSEWITFTQSKKEDIVQDALDKFEELRTHNTKSVDELVSMLDSIYSRGEKLDEPVIDPLWELILGE